MILEEITFTFDILFFSGALLALAFALCFSVWLV